MLQISNNKIGFLGATIFLLIGLLFIPTAIGTGGTSRGNAPAYGPGTYLNEYFYMGDSAYYNVSGNVGANLSVTITCSAVFDLKIFATNGVLVASSTGSGTVYASAILNTRNNYTIAVGDNAVFSRPPGTFFNLTISLTDESYNGFPFFLVIFFSIVILVGAILFYRNRKLSFNI
jgi:hypothetical protein